MNRENVDVTVTARAAFSPSASPWLPEMRLTVPTQRIHCRSHTAAPTGPGAGAIDKDALAWALTEVASDLGPQRRSANAAQPLRARARTARWCNMNVVEPSGTELSINDVSACLHRLFIGDDASTLRKEDRQKAAELLPLLEEIRRRVVKKPSVFVDACAGKSALGLVAAALVLPATYRVVIVERDAARVAQARRAAAALNHDIVVVEGDVGVVPLPHGAHIVAALHACGAACDAVIAAAADAEALHLLLVPCCYGAHPARVDAAAIPGQIASARFVDMLPRQGLVGRRFAQALIDAERTLRLEELGYDVEVVEFVAPTVTPHNLLWRARRSGEPRRKAEAARRRQLLLAP